MVRVADAVWGVICKDGIHRLSDFRCKGICNYLHDKIRQIAENQHKTWHENMNLCGTGSGTEGGIANTGQLAVYLDSGS